MSPFWIAFLCSAVAAYPLYRWLLAIKSRQTVSQYIPEHAHKQGTPTMGGLVMLVGLVVSFGLLTGVESARGFAVPALILTLGFGLIGFVDDFVIPRVMVGKRGLGWTPKLAMQIAVAALAAFATPGRGGLADAGLLVFLVLFYSNAYNFADGLDALAGSLLLGMVFGFVGTSNPEGFLAASGIGAALAGAAIPFLVLNAPPAKIFMGDVGALPIGALLGLVAALGIPTVASGQEWLPIHWLPTLLWSGMMVAELVPVPLQIFWVKAFKRRLFPATPIHHSFQRAGWVETRIVWIFFLVQILLSTAAIHVGGALR